MGAYVIQTENGPVIIGGVGPKGDKGDPGKSAYEYAQEAGFVGTEEEFATKLAEETPDALPNPYPLTINGKSYDGSEAVDLVITGGTASDAVSLGQTPVTLTQSANIRLVGDGEYSYTVKGKTVADLSVATVVKTNVEIAEHEDYTEITATGGSSWFNAYATFKISGLTAGTKYMLSVVGNASPSISQGAASLHFVLKTPSGTQLATLSADGASGHLENLEFTPSDSAVDILWYPATNYYWNQNCKTASIQDFYINKASDGTERTDIFDKSGTFTDSYLLGQVSKGITITTTPSCEVYNMIGGGGSTEAGLPLVNKTVVCFGDSLFGMYTGATSAPAYVAQKTGATVYNVGFGGCRMSEHPYTSHNPFCMYALANAIASGDWSLQDANAASGSANFPDQLAILKAIDFGKVDYIVIHYGTNDFTAGVGVAIDNASNPKATNTLCGALRHSVETLLTAYPKLRIFVSLPAFRYWEDSNGNAIYPDAYTNNNGYKLTDFIEALANTAKEYNLPIIDSYYGLGINASNATAFIPDGTHHNDVGRKRFGEYIGAKLISEGDTFHGADSENGGSGVDVTASVGQTIVVEEVDANGKPTKWKAAEYQPRTHWTGAKVLVPEHTFEAGISGPNMVMHGDIKLLGLTVGKTYTVVFDGVTYTCVAETGQVTQDGVNMLDIISIGNLGMFGGTDNGLPFILGDLPFYNNGTWMCLPYVYGEHTLSIVDNAGVYPIPVQYVTNAFPYYIEITGSGTADDPYVCAESVANVNAIYASGRPLVVRFTDAQHFTWHIPMVWGAVVSAGSLYYFYVKWAGSDISAKRFVLASQDDGTFAVSNELSD